MSTVTLKLTERELQLLASLTAEQIFREEFINPKIPGHRASPEDIALGKDLVARMRLMMAQASSQGESKRNVRQPSVAASTGDK